MQDTNSTSSFKLLNNTFGKGKTKVLHLSRNGWVKNFNFNQKFERIYFLGLIHTIRELEITHRVKLEGDKEYIDGDNSGIVESDSHAKLLYILAKNQGINSPEEFGIAFCKELLSRYKQILKVFTYIEETTWKRIKYTNANMIVA